MLTAQQPCCSACALASSTAGTASRARALPTCASRTLWLLVLGRRLVRAIRLRLAILLLTVLRLTVLGLLRGHVLRLGPIRLLAVLHLGRILGSTVLLVLGWGGSPGCGQACRGLVEAVPMVLHTHSRIQSVVLVLVLKIYSLWSTDSHVA